MNPRGDITYKEAIGLGPIMPIRLWPDPALSTVCDPVTEEELADPDFVKFCEYLTETMNLNGRGIGLAAPQVGVLKRVFIAKTLRYGDMVVVNPTLGLEGATTLDNEGCLSLPGLHDQVARSVSCTLKCVTQNQDGGFDEREFWFVDGEENGGSTHWENIPARIIQHEFDHIEATMFFMRMSKQMRKHILRQWEKKNR
jgi:peptide deformylase